MVEDEALWLAQRQLIGRYFDNEYMPSFHFAALIGDTEWMEILLDGEDKESIRTIIEKPIGFLTDSAQELLALHGVHYPEKLSHGLRPLALAVIGGNIEPLEVLLRHNADPWTIVEGGVSAVELACMLRRPQLAKMLHGRSSYKGSSGPCPLLRVNGQAQPGQKALGASTPLAA